jgi:hypothetical protein
MGDRTVFKCDICKKNYSSYKSRWLHIKKYHSNNVVNNVVNVVEPVVNGVVKNDNNSNIKKITYVDFVIKNFPIELVDGDMKKYVRLKIIKKIK